MNKKTSTIILTIIVIILIALIAWNKNIQIRNATQTATVNGNQSLDKTATEDDSNQINDNLDNIHLDSSSTEDFRSVDADIKSI